MFTNLFYNPQRPPSLLKVSWPWERSFGYIFSHNFSYLQNLFLTWTTQCGCLPDRWKDWKLLQTHMKSNLSWRHVSTLREKAFLLSLCWLWVKKSRRLLCTKPCAEPPRSQPETISKASFILGWHSWWFCMMLSREQIASLFWAGVYQWCARFGPHRAASVALCLTHFLFC